MRASVAQSIALRPGGNLPQRHHARSMSESRQVSLEPSILADSVDARAIKRRLGLLGLALLASIILGFSGIPAAARSEPVYHSRVYGLRVQPPRGWQVVPRSRFHQHLQGVLDRQGGSLQPVAAFQFGSGRSGVTLKKNAGASAGSEQGPKSQPTSGSARRRKGLGYPHALLCVLPYERLGYDHQPALSELERFVAPLRRVVIRSFSPSTLDHTAAQRIGPPDIDSQRPSLSFTLRSEEAEIGTVNRRVCFIFGRDSLLMLMLAQRSSGQDRVSQGGEVWREFLNGLRFDPEQAYQRTRVTAPFRWVASTALIALALTLLVGLIVQRSNAPKSDAAPAEASPGRRQASPDSGKGSRRRRRRRSGRSRAGSER